MSYKRDSTGRLKKSQSAHVLSPLREAAPSEESRTRPNVSKISMDLSSWVRRTSEDENLLLVTEEWKKKKKTGAEMLKDLKRFVTPRFLYNISVLNLSYLAHILHDHGVQIDLDAEVPLVYTFRDLLGHNNNKPDESSHASEASNPSFVPEFRAARDMLKAYENEATRYGGDLCENLCDFERGFKFRCVILQVPEPERPKLLECALKDEALDYYIEHLQGKQLSLDEVFEKLRTGGHFRRKAQATSEEV